MARIAKEIKKKYKIGSYIIGSDPGNNTSLTAEESNTEHRIHYEWLDGILKNTDNQILEKKIEPENPCLEVCKGIIKPIKPKNKKKYPNILLNAKKNDKYILNINSDLYISFKFLNELSTDILAITDIRKPYYDYGSDSTIRIINYLIKNHNKIDFLDYSHTKPNFILLSVPKQYTELVDYLYSISETVSDFKMNSVEGETKAIFTINLK